MERRKLRIEFKAFRSIVARRVFLLFVLSSLIPLAVLAYFSLDRVTKQLERQARERLSQTSKSTGIFLFEQLRILAADLELVGRELPRRAGRSPAAAGVVLGGELQARFKNLFLVGAHGNLLWSAKPTETLPPALTDAGRAHLEGGEPLLLVRGDGETSGSDIFMARRTASSAGAAGILYGEVNPDFLLGEGAQLFEDGGFLVIDRSHHVILSQFQGNPPLREFRDALLAGENGSGSFEFTRQDAPYVSGYWTLFLRPRFLTERWTIAVFEKKAEVLAPIRDFKRIFLLVALLSFWCILLFSLVQIRRILVPIEHLTKATRRIGRGDLDSKVEIRSRDDFQQLGESFNEMIGRLKEHVTAMETINQIGISLSSESQDLKLLEIILRGAKRIINADGGAIYTLKDGGRLELSMLHIDSVPLEIAADKDGPVALKGLSEETERRTVAACSTATGETVNVEDVYSGGPCDLSGHRAFDEAIGYHTQSVLAVPMKNHEGEVTGVIQLMNARGERSGEVGSFTEENEELLESLASQAGVALAKNDMLLVFKRLFESLVELIAKAIDEKSPYTGDHCRRVPVLVEMLTEAACKTRQGNLKDFNLSEDELYEMKVATLLHDCGKVTTPVHIVDKSTKLEKIFDRMYLLETRFEVLKRDAEISFFRRRIAALEKGESFDAEEEERKLQASIHEMEVDKQALRAANAGVEWMDERLRDQVKEIKKKYRWVNPAGEEEPFLSEEEAGQLLIPYGTLSPEDREIINYHMVATNKMLESLSYPKNMRNVPKYAGVHHERLDGSGYPRGLQGDEIPIQGRIIAIADVFEALTAKDRPYKTARSLSESLDILKLMRDEGKLDRDLVDLFIQEKVYLRYAEQYLDPEQIDEKYLSEFQGYRPPN